MKARYDPVRLSIYQHLLAACAEEMGAALGRSASSANIKERRDYSCAVFDHAGNMVAQAAHIPVHLGSMPLSVAAALRRGPLERGDAVLVNDPYEGGTHLPDITLVAPVFLPGERRARFYVANRAHHADVGGMSPGSLPLSTEMVQEGVRIPPVKIVRAGAVQSDLWRLICANVRTPLERQADLEAQLGAAHAGARRLVELAARSGPDELSAYCGHLLDYAERGVQAVLATIRPGRYAFTDHLDDAGHGGPPIPIRVAISVRGGRATIDFAGTAAQVEGPLNAVYSITLSAVLYAFRCLAGRDLPTNAGCLRPLTVVAPEGSLVHCRYPAAVSSGNVETSQRITDVLFGALARALPGRLPAASYGTMNNVLIGGTAKDGSPFAYYETLGGGHGAGPTWNGASGLQAHMTNTLNTPIEAFEHLFPMRVTRYALRPGSGGRGKHRGGDGLVREIELLVPATVTVISERRRLAPWGAAGGEDGAKGRNRRVDGKSGRARGLPGKFQQRFEAGDRLVVESPGGGGYGPPAARRRRGAR
ncbi:MAG: hydantoinase B/oxoprolinase family protein [Candidatus Eisenbacteria bacterium]